MGNDVYPIPAAAFDTVEGVVGHFAQSFRIQWVLGGPDCRSDAHRDGERPARGIEWPVADGDPEPFGAFL